MRAYTSGTGATRRNERLAKAMKDASLRFSDLAVAAGVNVKSAQRWVYEGRVPQKRSVAVKLGHLLGTDPGWLWPKWAPRLRSPDLVHIYDQLADVPDGLWLDLAKSAEERITLASNTLPLFPVEGMPDLLELCASDGVEVQLCLGRSHRATHLRRVESRRASHSDMISIFRFDSTMLVWLNRGGPGLDRLGPVLHLTRADDNGLFDAYAFVLRSLWIHASADLLYARRS